MNISDTIQPFDVELESGAMMTPLCCVFDIIS